MSNLFEKNLQHIFTMLNLNFCILNVYQVIFKVYKHDFSFTKKIFSDKTKQIIKLFLM